MGREGRRSLDRGGSHEGRTERTPGFRPQGIRHAACTGEATETTTPAPAASATAEAPATADQPATAEAPAVKGDKPTAESTAPAATTDETKTAAIDKSQLKEIPAGEIRSEELVGTTVYGANDENVGEIGDVVLSTDGKVNSIIIDVGGFLGIGEKEVAVGMDNLAFMTDKDGNKYLYTKFTKEQLDAAAAYDKSTSRKSGMTSV